MCRQAGIFDANLSALRTDLSAIPNHYLLPRMNRPLSNAWAYFCAIACLLLAANCVDLRAADHSELTKPHSESSDEIELLTQIEQRVLPLPLVPGLARFEKLEDYYWAANPALRRRLDDGIAAFSADELRSFRAMTLVAGSAGVGKTFVKRGVYNDKVPRQSVWKIDARELLEQWIDKGLAAKKPDVHHKDQVISELTSLTPAGRKAFIDLLHSQKEAFFVVDSLDEIHPDDDSFILSELEKLVLHGDRSFIHVVVFGRPLAFRKYWNSLRHQHEPINVQSYLLSPPDFRTTGDLLVSSWNYDCWKHRLRRVGKDGEPAELTFADYQQWFAADCATAGEFSDVCFEQNSEMRPEARRRLQRCLTENRVALGVIPNLAGNSLLREVFTDHLQDGINFEERAFMDWFFAKWLERDTKSSDRPSRMKPEFLELYIQLLEAVAAKYADQTQLDRLGFFEVRRDDTIDVRHNGEVVSVSIQRLLDRSGFVTADPLHPESDRYRFEPIWTHRLLLEMHSERHGRDTAQPVAAVTQ